MTPYIYILRQCTRHPLISSNILKCPFFPVQNKIGREKGLEKYITLPPSPMFIFPTLELSYLYAALSNGFCFKWTFCKIKSIGVLCQEIKMLMNVIIVGERKLTGFPYVRKWKMCFSSPVQKRTFNPPSLYNLKRANCNQVINWQIPPAVVMEDQCSAMKF